MNASILAKNLRAGDVIVTSNGTRQTVTTDAEILGGSGLVRFKFDADRTGRLSATTRLTIQAR